MGERDLLVEEIEATRRNRRRIVVIAVLAIIVGAAIGIAVTLGAISRTY